MILNTVLSRLAVKQFGLGMSYRYQRTLKAMLSLSVGLFIDISEQKWAEKSLRDSKRQYRAVIETSDDSFWLTDSTGRILEINDTYARLSGYSKDELVGMHISDLEAEENQQETARHIEKIIGTGSDLFETRHQRKSGEIWDVEISTSYSPISGVRFSVFARDITERKRTQHELHLISRDSYGEQPWT